MLGTVIHSVCSLSVGQLYDRMGRTWAWTLVLGLLAAAATLSFILIRRDRVKFPKLYEQTKNAE